LLSVSVGEDELGSDVLRGFSSISPCTVTMSRVVMTAVTTAVLGEVSIDNDDRRLAVRVSGSRENGTEREGKRS
jgi:hypothetical protein